MSQTEWLYVVFHELLSKTELQVNSSSVYQHTLFLSFLHFSLPLHVSWGHLPNPYTQILISESAFGGTQNKTMGFLTIILTLGLMQLPMFIEL